jgi:thiamine pyrophosphate-dependent acetolactate synthase large subunit-like protein
MRGKSAKSDLLNHNCPKGKDVMAYDDPRWMGCIDMIGIRAAYNAVLSSDLLLMVGADYPYWPICRTRAR